MCIDGNMSRASFEVDSVSAVDVEIFLFFDFIVPWEEMLHLVPRKVTLDVYDDAIFYSAHGRALIDIEIKSMMDTIS